MTRYGKTRALAEASALDAVRERLEANSDGRWTNKTPIVQACSDWLESNTGEGGRLSERTGEVYYSAYRRAIADGNNAISGLTLAQVNDGQRLRRYLDGVASAHGTGTAKHVRAILSGVLKEAVSYRVLPTNELLQAPGVKTVAPKRGGGRDLKRAMTDDELRHVRQVADEWAAEPVGHPATAQLRRSAAALVYVLSGTGMRIGEALALRWEHIDLETGRVDVFGTKTESSVRVLTFPRCTLEHLRTYAKACRNTDGLVFPSPRLADTEHPWAQRNANRALREVLDLAGMEWAVSHSFRRSVATSLHRGGVGVNRVADWLGHADASVTARVYLGRDLLGDKSDLAQVLQ